jgi:hypothetical protein
MAKMAALLHPKGQSCFNAYIFKILQGHGHHFVAMVEDINQHM